MFFTLKILLTHFLVPMPIILLTATVGLVFLWFTSRRKTGLVLVSSAVLVLGLLSYWPLSEAMLESLENRYSSLYADGKVPSDDKTASDVKWVVVLGSGHVADARYPMTGQLSSSALYRLVEGIRLHRLFPRTKLLLSGGFGAPGLRHAEVAARAAEILGVPRQEIVTEPRPL